MEWAFGRGPIQPVDSHHKSTLIVGSLCVISFTLLLVPLTKATYASLCLRQPWISKKTLSNITLDSHEEKTHLYIMWIYVNILMYTQYIIQKHQCHHSLLLHISYIVYHDSEISFNSTVQPSWCHHVKVTYMYPYILCTSESTQCVYVIYVLMGMIQNSNQNSKVVISRRKNKTIAMIIYFVSVSWDTFIS